MRVTISTEAVSLIRQRGGVLYVRPRYHRCCSGGMTVLNAVTDAPSDGAEYASVTVEGVDLRYWGSGSKRPDELVVVVRGWLRKQAVAYWDGCAYRP
jgi:hypothetical protein